MMQSMKPSGEDAMPATRAGVHKALKMGFITAL
jgi:hypothetical protein